MPSIKSPRASIRLARLDDAAAISEVHRSHIDRWVRVIGDERHPVGYDALSVDERWGFGGPWMSVETCAVHLNHLLTGQCYPIVMVEDDRVVAHLELYVQREGQPYNMNCHIGLLYVHKDFGGQGRGHRMVDYALQFARERRCDTLTVSARPENEGFYRKCGFSLGDTLVDVGIKVQPSGVDTTPLPRPVSSQSFTWGMGMRIGRYQSSGYHINFLSERQAVSVYGDMDVRTGFCAVAGHPAMFARVCHHFANVDAAFAWTKDAGMHDLALALIHWLHEGGLRSVNTQMSLKDYEAIQNSIESHVMGTRRGLIHHLRSGP